MEPAEALADCLRGVAETLRHHRDLGFREITLSRDPFSEPPVSDPAFPDPSFSDPSLSDPSCSDPVEALRVQEQARAGCKLCKLCKSRSTIVFGVGNPRARLMVVGEGPGEEEDKQGIPFVGRAGQLLNSMLRAAGFERGEVYIANVLKSRPPNNRDPAADETDHCLPYLRRQIELVDPAVILCVGRIAAQRLLEREEPLARLRGRIHRLGRTPVIVTYHPAYLLRSPTEKRKSWDDIKLALGVLADGDRA